MNVEPISMFCDFIAGLIPMRIMAVFFLLLGYVCLLELRMWLIDSFFDGLAGKDEKK